MYNMHGYIVTYISFFHMSKCKTHQHANNMHHVKNVDVHVDFEMRFVSCHLVDTNFCLNMHVLSVTCQQIVCQHIAPCPGDTRLFRGPITNGYEKVGWPLPVSADVTSNRLVSLPPFEAQGIERPCSTFHTTSNSTFKC